MKSSHVNKSNPVNQDKVDKRSIDRAKPTTSKAGVTTSRHRRYVHRDKPEIKQQDCHQN